MSESSWELYYSIFNIGDFIVAITDDDSMVCGTITSQEPEEDLVLSLGKTEEEVPWETIVFMAHDGFPVKKVISDQGLRSVRELKAINEIREELTKKRKKSNAPLIRPSKPICNTPSGTFRSHRFGDPWEVPSDWLRLYNPDMSNDPRRYDTPYEETLIGSYGGITFMQWFLPSIYGFEL
tara:strand:+ start:517 stop:1056 length:540 start_codon:yes stop_codon:yes gene_type:complete